MTRKSSTATAPAARRNVGVVDVFSYGLTATLATAAVADARRKDERVEAWDRAIEDVKSGKDLASIRTPDMVSIGKAAEGKDNIMGLPVAKTEAEKEGLRQLDPNTVTLKQTLLELGTSVAKAYEEAYVPDDPAGTILQELAVLLEAVPNTQKTIKWLNEIQEARENETRFDEFYEDESSRFRESKMAPSEPNSSKWLEAMEQTASSLVIGLIKDGLANRGVYAGSTDKAKNVIVKAIKQRLRTLIEDVGFKPSYRPTRDNHRIDSRRVEDTLAKRNQMNASIRDIFKSGRDKSQDMTFAIAKVCYNLLVSPAAPDVTTYNILLENLTRMKQYKLVDVVLNSFTYNAVFIKPNEWTFACLLNYYTATNNKRAFSTTIKQMNGQQGGIGLRSYHLHAARHPKVQEWLRSNEFKFSFNVIRETANRNSLVWEAAIAGYLKMFGLRYALGALRRAVQEGALVRKWLFEKIMAYVDSVESSDKAADMYRDFVVSYSYGWSDAALSSTDKVRLYLPPKDQLSKILRKSNLPLPEGRNHYLPVVFSGKKHSGFDALPVEERKQVGRMYLQMAMAPLARSRKQMARKLDELGAKLEALEISVPTIDSEVAVQVVSSSSSLSKPADEPVQAQDDRQRLVEVAPEHLKPEPASHATSRQVQRYPMPIREMADIGPYIPWAGEPAKRLSLEA
jgi:hypothetical protein